MELLLDVDQSEAPDLVTVPFKFNLAVPVEAPPTPSSNPAECVKALLTVNMLLPDADCNIMFPPVCK